MDRQLIRRIHQCISCGDITLSKGVEANIDQLCQYLQLCYPEYKRRKAKPFRRMVQSTFEAYEEATATPDKRPMQEDKHSWTIDRRPTGHKKAKISMPLKELQPDDFDDEFTCECGFRQEAKESTADYFSTDSSEKFRKLCRTVLLVSGPPGSGKTCFSKWLCRTHELPLICVDPVLDLEERFVKLTEFLNQRLVILIEDIDDSPLASGPQNTGSRTCRLFKLLVESLKEKQPGNRAIIICTCRDPGSLKDTVRTLVDGEIKIPAPGKLCREAILRSLLNCSHQWLSDVAELTPSFLPVHLCKLSSLAVHRCCQRAPEADLELHDFLNVLQCESTTNNIGNILTSQSANAVQVPEVSWKDIGALDEVRKILQETLLTQCKSALEANGRLNRLGVLSEPSGVLLVGPPGCGKTLLAKAVANELSVNFLAVNGPELLNMYVGESERSVRQLFRQASDFKPCIIFFDEVDALCSKRSEKGPVEGPLVLNQLLVEMDGIRGRRGVYLMAATNVLDAIDPAMTRPGRFGTLVYVGLPSKRGRVEILKKMVKDCGGQLSSACIDEVASKTNGYTGADLKNLVCTAARYALNSRTGAEELTEEDLKVGLARTKPSLTAEQIKKYESNQRSRCCNCD